MWKSELLDNSISRMCKLFFIPFIPLPAQKGRLFLHKWTGAGSLPWPHASSTYKLLLDNITDFTSVR